MAVTAGMVKELRERTGAGMMDCKKALEETNGDIEGAIELMRKNGQAKAAKKAGRIAAEGTVLTRVGNGYAVAIEFNCETDFVGKNESFVKLAQELAALALNFDSKEAFLATDFHGITVADKLIEQTGVIGEKIEISSFERLEGAFVGSYIHAGNKIATLVSLSANVAGAEEASRNVAMQAAAMNPIALNEAGVDAAVIEKEIEIAKEQLRAEGKPEAMLENISKGKIQRFYKDNTLVNQDYIKDGAMNVAAYVKSVDANLTVTGFKRAALG